MTRDRPVPPIHYDYTSSAVSRWNLNTPQNAAIMHRQAVAEAEWLQSHEREKMLAEGVFGLVDRRDYMPYRDNALRSNAAAAFDSLRKRQPSAELVQWWARLQDRGVQLGDDEMSYSEWSQWMDELDAFKKEAA